MANLRLLACLFLVLPAAAWGGMFHVAQRVLPQIDPFWLTLMRLFPTALIMLALWAWRESAAPQAVSTVGRAPSRMGWKLAVAGLVGFGVFNFALYSGIALTTPEHAAIIMAMTPLLGAALAWGISRRAPPRLTLICIGVALVGAVCVVTGHAAGSTVMPHAVAGDALVALGALSWAFYLRAVAWFPTWSSLRFSAFTTAMGTLWVGLGLLLLTLVERSHAPVWRTLPALGPELFYMIFLGTLAALLLWNRGVALIGPVNGALFMNLVPVSAFVIGIALGHRPAPVEVMGALLVLGALLANNLLLRRPLPTAS